MIEVAGLTDADTTGANDTDGQTPLDTDSDGIANFIDIDSDDDGIVDTVEAQSTLGFVDQTGIDADSDGVQDIFDTATENGAGGEFSALEDTDSDGTADYIDVDSDNDGLSDAVESGNRVPIGFDQDSDGLDDGVFAQQDTDSDGTIDFDASAGVNAPFIDLLNIDTDSLDVDFRSLDDRDSDGISDELDIDDDNDGIVDTDEQLFSNEALTDLSGVLSDGTTYTVSIVNGTLNVLANGDFDINSITTSDIAPTVTIEFSRPTNVIISPTTANHGFVLQGGSTGSADGFFATNGADWINDLSTAFQSGLSFDGQVATGTFTNEATSNANYGSISTIGATTIVLAESSNGGYNLQALVEIDTDSDGVVDRLDLDSDDDGISDLVESGANASLVDTDRDGVLDGSIDTDSDGLFEVAGITDSDITGANDTDGQAPLDTDSDGDFDFVDTDSDSDGISDILEGQPTLGFTSGVDADSDSDGIDDNLSLIHI